MTFGKWQKMIWSIRFALFIWDWFVLHIAKRRVDLDLQYYTWSCTADADCPPLIPPKDRTWLSNIPAPVQVLVCGSQSSRRGRGWGLNLNGFPAAALSISGSRSFHQRCRAGAAGLRDYAPGYVSGPAADSTLEPLSAHVFECQICRSMDLLRMWLLSLPEDILDVAPDVLVLLLAAVMKVQTRSARQEASDIRSGNETLRSLSILTDEELLRPDI